MKKRLFPALLALVLALTMLSVGVFASADSSGTTGTPLTLPTGKSAEEYGKMSEDAKKGYALFVLDSNYYSVDEYKQMVTYYLNEIGSDGKSTTSERDSASIALRVTLAVKSAETITDSSASSVVAEMKTAIGEIKTLEFSGSGMKDLGRLEYFTGLTTLKILNCANLSTAIEPANAGGQKIDGLGALDKLTSLKTLVIKDCKNVKSLNALAKCTDLEYLDASGCDLTPVTGTQPVGGTGTIDGISGIEPCTKLTYLDLSGNTNLGSTSAAPAAMGPLYSLPNLETLKLSNTAITSDDMVPVWAPTQDTNKVKTNLKTLDVSHNDNLTELKIPENITKLETVNADGLTLENLEYPASQTTNVTLTNTKLTVTDTNKDKVAALVKILAEKAPDAGLKLENDQNTTLYTVTAGTVTGGTITVDKLIAAAGDTVTITATPSSGYQVGTITVKDSDNGDVTVTSNTFTMPAKNVTVTATFKLAPETINATYTAGGSLIGGKITLSGLTQGHTYICQISRSKTTIEYNGGTIDAHNGPDTVAIMFTADSASKDILLLNSGTGEYFVSVWSSINADPKSLADTTISSLSLTKVTAAP